MAEIKLDGYSTKKGRLLIDSMEDLDELSWEWLMDDLTELMNVGESVYWVARVKNFGWMNSDGHKIFKAEDGDSLLRNILPDTDCHFKIYRYQSGGFAIQCYHHDSPTGNEWYYVSRIMESTYNRLTG